MHHAGATSQVDPHAEVVHDSDADYEAAPAKNCVSTLTSTWALKANLDSTVGGMHLSAFIVQLVHTAAYNLPKGT